MAEKRYIVKAPTNAGTYAAQFGWLVIDTQPVNPSCCFVMSGGQRQAQRWARELNAR